MIIVDNWYDDPHGIREFALSKFKTEKEPGTRKKDNGFEVYPGTRTKASLENLIDNKLRMERHMERSIDPTMWAFSSALDREIPLEEMEFDFAEMKARVKGTDIYPNLFYGISNGCFQSCNEKSKMWIHADEINAFAAVVYLTPDPPEGTGTGFFKNKRNGLSVEPRSNPVRYKPEEASDFDQWEMVDYCENVFNRCVIFNAKQYHSATKYFGTTLENSRLTQVFFFDMKSNLMRLQRRT